MACETCNSTIPEIGQKEIAVAFAERMVKRLWIALIITVVLMFASNAAWLYAWCRYDYYSEETVIDVNSDDGGNANYIGNDGDIYNGESYGNETTETAEAKEPEF